ncbi:hypothetical protein ACPEIF_20235 [Streptomyces sp. NPDC012600]|uniref:hypothetical protein n=1 Tax=Streptomyces sp. NPDC012600 TaxID=3415005 RepID=UPI003C2CB662
MRVRAICNLDPGPSSGWLGVDEGGVHDDPQRRVRRSRPTSAVAGQTVTGDAVSYAQCPADKDLIGEGYNTNFGFNGFHQTSDTITANGPSAARSGAWAVRSSSGGETTAYALCRAR